MWPIGCFSMLLSSDLRRTNVYGFRALIEQQLPLQQSNGPVPPRRSNLLLVLQSTLQGRMSGVALWLAIASNGGERQRSVGHLALLQQLISLKSRRHNTTLYQRPGQRHRNITKPGCPKTLKWQRMPPS